MDKLHKLAFKIFGNYVRKNKKDFGEIQKVLRQSHINIPWDIYSSTSIFVSIMATLVILILGIILGLLLKPFWYQIYLLFPKFGPVISFTHKEDVVFILVLVFISAIVGVVMFIAQWIYPSFSASIRKSKIDLTLPHAVSYMHAMSKGGLNLVSIFKSLSEQVDIYGETAEEISYILIDTELRGKDINEALKHAAIMTPSDKFRDFLENLVNITETSGELEKLFENMVHQFQLSAEADQYMYLEVLGMLAETYVTAFVAGPLFLITILIVMGLMGKSSLLIIQMLVYILIPLSAAAFSILLTMIALESDTKLIKIYTVSKKIRRYDDIRNFFADDDERKIRRFVRSLRWTSVIETRKNPLKIFFAKPENIYYVTIPLSLLFLISYLYFKGVSIDTFDDAIIISILLLFVPFLFFYEIQSRRIRGIDDSVPVFLKGLAVINDVGMPISQAIKSITKINLGVLSSEVKVMYKDLVWTNSVLDALTKFERRVRTVSISRIVTLISKASESTGNIKETLRVAATDAALAERLRRQKFTALFSYLIVVYMSFGVFMLVLYVFATMFIPQIPTPTEMNKGMLSIGADKSEYIRLFMHASVIQGFFSGIIAGQMMGQSIYDGLKHSIIMVTIAYVAFVFFV